MKHICDQIDEFIEAELKTHPEQVKQFFERVQSNYDEAIRTATRYLLFMFAAWFLTYAIHEGWVGKIGWLGFEFKRKMTIASPFLIGLLSYGMLSALAGAVVLSEAMIRRLRYMLPTAWKNYLDNFLAVPTFSNIERMLEPMIDPKPLSVYFSRFWFLLVTLMMFGGGLAGIAHTTSLLFQPEVATEATRPEVAPQVIHWAVIVASAALGVLAWLRGVVLAVFAVGVTGGYNLTHHRGTRTEPPPDRECPADSPSTSLAPSSQQQQPPTIHPRVAPTVIIYRRAHLFDVRRAGGVILVKRKKRRGGLTVRA
jgi:hypothetical protein